MKVILVSLVFVASLTSCGSDSGTLKPNFVIIFCDDLGYGDLGCYGNEKHRTPNLDRMATEGVRFSDFYVSSGVCTPSRSSLMTGCYPRRVDMHVNARPWGSVGRQVLFPLANKGLNPEEITIAEILKSQGYATACIGKWHLGDQEPFLPTRQGFDYYYGIPYSNDMDREYCPLPLMRNEEVIEAPVDQNSITERYTFEILDFIEKNKDRPFFIYLPHAMTHNPLYAGERFRGKSANGIYGDAVEEIDWSTGEILAYLRETGLAAKTLVIFTSDNGASSNFGGSNAPLRGWKGSTWEGGMREPTIFWWPGRILDNYRCEVMASTMDILPTLASLAGAEVPLDRIVDGKNIWPVLTNAKADPIHEVFYYYQLEQLQAVRMGDWKLHLPLDSMYENVHRAIIKEGRSMALYNLKKDINESNDQAEAEPEIVAQLLEKAEIARQDLGDFGVEGNNTRPAALVQNPVAQLLDSMKTN